jgi:hypothetical protein
MKGKVDDVYGGMAWKCSVADPHRVDAVPDPPFHFDAVPDPPFHFDADPGPIYFFDADPDSTLSFDAVTNLNPHQMIISATTGTFLQAFHGSILSLRVSISVSTPPL